jgi:DNA replication protein DnaC
MEQVSIARAVAREYDRRRQQTEAEREQRRLDAYRLHPALQELDRAIAAAGADQLLEVIDPHRPQQARQLRQQLLDQRTELLACFGLGADFDQIRPICPVCRDSGVAGHQRCHCYRQILVPLLTAQANLRSLAGMHFENFDETLFSDEADPARYKSEHSPRAQIGALRRICETYVARFDQLEQRNLLFVGPPGTGKTYLMACVANALLAQGRSVLYVSAPALFEIMGNYRTQLASFHPDEIRFEQATALHDLVLNSELLLVDDLGTEPAAASRYADLLAIIDHRAGAGRHTLISSNADPGALRETYDERLLSRLLGSFAIYRFFGPDVRLVLSRRRRG